MPFKNLKPGLRQQSTSHLRCKPVNHKLKEIEGSARNVRRRCAGFYEKLRQQQSRETSAATAKRIKAFCRDCDKFFYLDCFNEKHFSE